MNPSAESRRRGLVSVRNHGAVATLNMIQHGTGPCPAHIRMHRPEACAVTGVGWRAAVGRLCDRPVSCS